MIKGILPDSWEWKSIAEVGEVVSGGTPSTQVAEYFDGDIPWITPADLSKYQEKLIARGKRNISIQGLKNSSARLIPKGSILFSSRAPVGYVAISSNELSTNQGFKSLIPFNSLNADYAYYYLRSIKQLAESIATGTTFKELSSTAFKQIPIPIPPLAEQHRIVQKIEELFSELDHAEEQLKLAILGIQQYKRSLLYHAFKGYYTNGTMDWKYVKLRTVAEAVDPQPSHRTPPVDISGIPYVSTKDVDFEKDVMDLSTARKVPKSVLNEHLIRYELKPGDFIIGKIGTIGNPVRVRLPQEYTLSANVVLIQPRHINPTFLYYFFQSEHIIKQLQAGTRSTTQAAFGIQKVRELNIHLPSPDIQLLIVNTIESRLSHSAHLLQTAYDQLNCNKLLRKTILHNAFNGTLI